MEFRFKQAVVGGTFDFLHLGHQKLLLEAFNVAEQVDIGLTTDSFNTKRGKTTYFNQKQREKTLLLFLKKHQLLGRSKIFLISDPFGNSTTASGLDAIVVTAETAQTAEKINQARESQWLNPLTIIQVEHVRDVSDSIISSTRIRNGEIDQNGFVFKDFLQKIADKDLTSSIRQILKKPLGKIIPANLVSKKPKIITVGDITTKNFLDKKLTPAISIIDLKSKREHTFKNVEALGFTANIPITTVTNTPGEISKQLIAALANLISKSTNEILLVKGEEDLAVLPAVLLSPLKTEIYYGQPDEGLVKIVVTLEQKQKIKNLLAPLLT